MSSAAGEMKERSRGRGLKIWHRFVLAMGYAAILYLLARGVVYVLVVLEGLK
jgi:hypothetical protein